MGKSIVSDKPRSLKNGHQSKHESLCAKLHQAKSAAEVAMSSHTSDEHRYDLFSLLPGLLKAACIECEELTPVMTELPMPKASK